jgi:hypothetical protein
VRSTARTLLTLGIGVVAALLAACEGSQTGGPSTMPVALRAQTVGHTPATSNQKLLYVEADSSGTSIDILTFPQGSLVGTIPFDGPIWGMCTDDSGDVWVDILGGTLYEFAHGGTTPIAELTASGGDLATDCAVDPKTGDLALVDLASAYHSVIDVWTGAQGSPTVYPVSFFPWALTYDGSGNLFAVGQSGDPSTFQFAELPGGQSAFEPIELDAPSDWPGGIAWDGKHLVVATGGRSLTQRTYEVSVSGSKASVTRTLHFAHLAKQPWKVQLASDSIVSDEGRHQGFQLAVWRYPKGGKPYDILFGYDGRGVMSVAPSPIHSKTR